MISNIFLVILFIVKIHKRSDYSYWKASIYSRHFHHIHIGMDDAKCKFILSKEMSKLDE